MIQSAYHGKYNIFRSFKNIPLIYSEHPKLSCILIDFDMFQPASYIPQLGRVDPKKWGVSVCSLDGQRSAECPELILSSSVDLNKIMKKNTL